MCCLLIITQNLHLSHSFSYQNKHFTDEFLFLNHLQVSGSRAKSKQLSDSNN